ncbi:MAG: ABC transporter permease, partial [Butyrivibrio sp.]|nr:ABC transporter permease [Butyrivibrio sp.]
MSLVISVLEQGLIYAIMALGMYITYKILDFPDMTVDGSFPFGVALGVVLIRAGVTPILTLPICFLAGCGLGIITGIIHVVFKVRDLLAGIIMMTGLYSINLRIAGRANLPMYDYYTIFDNKLVNSIFPEGLSSYQTLIILVIITVIVKLILDLYLSTKSGFMLRAVGDNDVLVTSMGIDKG